MVKCVVSGCPNREVTVTGGVFNRPPKRFFKFPRDPAQVKVWLAALRETDKQNWTEQHLICEDHFLPEDISNSGVKSDAIPIMPPSLDGSLSMNSPWGAGSSEEEDEWATGGGDDDEDEAGVGGDDAPANVEPPEPEPPAAEPPEEPPQQDPAAQTTSEATSVSLHQKKETQTQRVPKPDVSLQMLTMRFLELLLANGSVDLGQVDPGGRRIHDVTDVLEGISCVEKLSANKFQWIGSCQITSFLWRNQQKFLRRELENLKLVEDTLDALIRSCAQQLFDITDDLQNAEFAYVTHEDVRRLAAFEEQTVIVVKAPEETKLEVPAPSEDSIQLHLKGRRGPTTVLTCDDGTEDGAGEEKRCFFTLEDSRIKTSTLRTESSSPQSTVQSA